MPQERRTISVGATRAWVVSGVSPSIRRINSFNACSAQVAYDMPIIRDDRIQARIQPSRESIYTPGIFAIIKTPEVVFTKAFYEQLRQQARASVAESPDPVAPAQETPTPDLSPANPLLRLPIRLTSFIDRSAEQVCARHRDYFVRLAEEIAPKLHGNQQAHWMDVLETEHVNMHQALTLCTEESESGEGGEAPYEGARELPQCG